jgi:hypothetical protein
MRTHLVTIAMVGMVALVSGCAREQMQTVASTSNPCRDPRLMMSCHQADVSGGLVADDDGEALASTKGKLASKSVIERRGVIALLEHRGATAPPVLSPPMHQPEPKGMRPPPPRH